jgi:hypothetical protein
MARNKAFTEVLEYIEGGAMFPTSVGSPEIRAAAARKASKLTIIGSENRSKQGSGGLRLRIMRISSAWEEAPTRESML